MKIKDSGTRRQFETGAVRDMQEGKGRMDLLPWCAIMRVARHFEAGAIKYGARNWERGIPLSSFCDSAARHLAKYMDGQDDEDHLCAAAWNLLCALWTEEKRPDLINIPSRPQYAGGAQYGREDEAEMVAKPRSWLLDNDPFHPHYSIEELEKFEEPDWPKVNPWLQKPEEPAEATISKEEPLETETSDERPAEAPATDKKIDTGKLGALRKAGWSIVKIADEMGLSTQTIRCHLKMLGLQ